MIGPHEQRYPHVIRGNAHRSYGKGDRLHSPLLIALSLFQTSLRLARRLTKETTQ